MKWHLVHAYPSEVGHPSDLDKLVKLLLVLDARLALDLWGSFLLGDATSLDG
jgi:hypothetical protein